MTTIAIGALRLHPDAERVPMADASDLRALRASLSENGQQDPLDVTEDGVILDGRTRWTLLRELGAIGKASADRAAAFFDELHDGTGTPKSSTRLLADWFRRRPAAVTRTGDSREPMELMVRAWNGWLAGRSFAFPKYRGFEWSRIRSPKA